MIAELGFERPSAARAMAFVELRDAFMRTGDDQWVGPRAVAHEDPVAYAAMVSGWPKGIGLPEGGLPVTHFGSLRATWSSASARSGTGSRLRSANSVDTSATSCIRRTVIVASRRSRCADASACSPIAVRPRRLSPVRPQIVPQPVSSRSAADGESRTRRAAASASASHYAIEKTSPMLPRRDRKPTVRLELTTTRLQIAGSTN